MKVAIVEDVLQGKIWAYSDEQRRKSKRQKDLANIIRLIETYPNLVNLLWCLLIMLNNKRLQWLWLKPNPGISGLG